MTRRPPTRRLPKRRLPKRRQMDRRPVQRLGQVQRPDRVQRLSGRL